jgi:hypothetical protein
MLLIAGGTGILVFINVKIASGLRFMADHKLTARVLETRLKLISPFFVAPLFRVPRVSTTVRQMWLLPSLFVVAWLLVTVMLVAKLQ